MTMMTSIRRKKFQHIVKTQQPQPSRRLENLRVRPVCVDQPWPIVLHLAVNCQRHMDKNGYECATIVCYNIQKKNKKT